MIPKIQDCSRLEQTLTKLEAAKQLFEHAFNKATEACELAKKELTRPLTLDEQKEYGEHLDGRLDI